MAGISTEVLFITGFGPIDRNLAESRALYADSLGIPFKEDGGLAHLIARTVFE